MFIVFEGIDGTGKSTQAKLLAEAFRQREISCILTREPGGSVGAEHIRHLVLAQEFMPMTELLLMTAARYEHWHNTIKPALDRNDWVVCDRYIDSTRAHQGFEAGIDLALIDQLHGLLQIPIKPTHVFILMLDIDTALSRARSRVQQDRYDHFDRSYYEKLYNGFLELAKTSPHYHLIDGNQSQKKIHHDVLRWLRIPILDYDDV